MKLSEFPESLRREISDDEFDLELPVMAAEVQVFLKRGDAIIVHKWKFEAKEAKEV